MRDEFSKHRYPGQERRRLLEAAEKTVSRSFLCLGFVVSQSVIVSRTACLFCICICICLYRIVEKVCRDTKNLSSYAPVMLVAEREDSRKLDEGNLRG